MDPSDSIGTSHSMRSDSSPATPVTVRCWGTRGSTPTPGPDTVRYGGNTSCVDVRAGKERIILDAGTGISLLGKHLKEDGEEKSASIFLTHFHWDHIQGLPFFAPAYDPDFQIHIFGPKQGDRGVQDLLKCQLGAPYFPISLEDLPASFSFSEIGEGALALGGFEIRAMRVRHSSFTLGYRVEAFGRSVVFIPDNELEGGPFETPPGWYEEFDGFVQGADLLLHDSMFTESEMSSSKGWGHSTFEQTLEWALRNQVRKLCFFHHAPGRSDSELDQLLQRFRDEVAERDGTLQLFAAEEGVEILL